MIRILNFLMLIILSCAFSTYKFLDTVVGISAMMHQLSNIQISGICLTWCAHFYRMHWPTYAILLFSFMLSFVRTSKRTMGIKLHLWELSFLDAKSRSTHLIWIVATNFKGLHHDKDQVSSCFLVIDTRAQKILWLQNH